MPLGIFGHGLGASGKGDGNGVDKSDKETTRKHYEKEERKQTPEERERARPPEDGGERSGRWL